MNRKKSHPHYVPVFGSRFCLLQSTGQKEHCTPSYEVPAVTLSGTCSHTKSYLASRMGNRLSEGPKNSKKAFSFTQGPVL